MAAAWNYQVVVAVVVLVGAAGLAEQAQPRDNAVNLAAGWFLLSSTVAAALATVTLQVSQPGHSSWRCSIGFRSTQPLSSSLASQSRA